MLPDLAGFWTPVALSADLPAGTVMPAQIPAGKIALWRSRSGRLSASADRCPHRGMSLSHGFVRGEALSCIYHGWSYSQAGHCLRIPAHPGLAPPETIRVETHRVEEAGGIVWIAVGGPAGAPPHFAGLAPLRTLTVEAAAAAIEMAAGGRADAVGLLRVSSQGGVVHCLLTSHGEAQTLVHILTDDGIGPAQKITASRIAEGLRRAAEAVQMKGIAA
ncbi:Rieske (2Fe-2S) protein [Rhizobium sp. TRM95111]|uniref:Rieske (2Fe-2S) protein n=1 Tax=Rhizobium alarense TaxID=2846851 RepID=UPI001F2A8319|nr:Rieske (2Fe-2S) protein [Rhizobium alarense]MCF3642082.1 Rieske (2Fe-2S) protein [Rhizobium alarense]